MDENLVRLTRDWLTKALHDIQNAMIIRQVSGDAPLDTAIYHCQQAAEKAVKGWLTWRGMSVVKTHDLGQLLAAAAEAMPGFAAHMDAGAILTPYVSAYRYPGLTDDLMPTAEELDLALHHAQSVYQYVLRLVPAEVRPLE